MTLDLDGVKLLKVSVCLCVLYVSVCLCVYRVFLCIVCVCVCACVCDGDGAERSSRDGHLLKGERRGARVDHVANRCHGR